MSSTKIDINLKKKIALVAMAALAGLLAICILITTLSGVIGTISEFGILNNGLPADQLTSIVVNEKDTHYGSLIVVNQLDNGEHVYVFPSESEAESNLINMYNYRANNGASYGLTTSTLKLHKDALVPAHNMLNALCKDIKGADIIVSGAYRTKEQQSDTGSIPVGYSEHHTGYILTVKGKEAPIKPEETDWLYENAQDYGFVFRYPSDKMHLTGLAYEYENCLRYVGVAHANLMKQENLCLEEYVEYLKTEAKNKHISVKCSNGEQYLIYYYDYEGMQINVNVPSDPEKYPYEISGTNYGGIVVTVKVK